MIRSSFFPIPFFTGMPPSKLGFVAKPEMPPHINILFRARPPLEFIPPVPKRHCKGLEGIYDGHRDYMDDFENDEPPQRQNQETPHQKKERIWKEHMRDHLTKMIEEEKRWNPQKDSNIETNKWKTLFVGKISYKTNEKKLKREFEVYGPVKRVKLITDKASEKPKGYAFIEFEHDKDFKTAYKQADGKKVDGRRLLVDIERGRTIEGWKPKRFGGGKGEGRKGKLDKKARDLYKEIKRQYDLEEEEEKREEDERRRIEEEKKEAERAKVEQERKEQMKDAPAQVTDGATVKPLEGEAPKEEKKEKTEKKDKKKKKHKSKDKRDRKDKKEKKSKKSKKERREKKRGKSDDKPEEGEVKDEHEEGAIIEEKPQS